MHAANFFRGQSSIWRRIRKKYNEIPKKNTNSKRRVLLQMATAIVTNDEGTKSTKIRLLLDNSSQRSYITDNLRSKLRLKPLQTEKLNLNTFSESKFKRLSCEVVNLRLQKSEHDNQITIYALTFPVIYWSVLTSTGTFRLVQRNEAKKVR